VACRQSASIRAPCQFPLTGRRRRLLIVNVRKSRRAPGAGGLRPTHPRLVGRWCRNVELLRIGLARRLARCVFWVVEDVAGACRPGSGEL